MRTMPWLSFVLLLTGFAAGTARAGEYGNFDTTSDFAYGEMTTEAARAYGNARYDEAFRKFQRLACAGDKASQAMVGRMYLSGEGIPRNDMEGYLWLKVAAEFNHAPYRTTVQRIESVLKPEQLKAWAGRADTLRDRYGLRATNMSCNQHASATFSSNVKDTVFCTPKREGGVVLLKRCEGEEAGLVGEATPLGTADKQ